MGKWREKEGRLEMQALCVCNIIFWRVREEGRGKCIYRLRNVVMVRVGLTFLTKTCLWL